MYYGIKSYFYEWIILMFRPQIQKTSTLLVIAIFNVLMVFLAVNSETKIKNNAFDVFYNKYIDLKFHRITEKFQEKL